MQSERSEIQNQAQLQSVAARMAKREIHPTCTVQAQLGTLGTQATKQRQHHNHQAERNRAPADVAEFELDEPLLLQILLQAARLCVVKGNGRQ